MWSVVKVIQISYVEYIIWILVFWCCEMFPAILLGPSVYDNHVYFAVMWGWGSQSEEAGEWYRLYILSSFFNSLWSVRDMETSFYLDTGNEHLWLCYPSVGDRNLQFFYYIVIFPYADS
jgi:hypothetical protein